MTRFVLSIPKVKYIEAVSPCKYRLPLPSMKSSSNFPSPCRLVAHQILLRTNGFAILLHSNVFMRHCCVVPEDQFVDKDQNPQCCCAFGSYAKLMMHYQDNSISRALFQCVQKM